MGPTQPRSTAPRKRVRKRKRRALSISSSSDSLSSSDSDSGKQHLRKPVNPVQVLSELSSSSSSSSSSLSSSSSDSDSDSDSDSVPITSPRPVHLTSSTKERQVRRFLSRSPPPTTIPSFIPASNTTPHDTNDEQSLRKRFRKFWMASVADGFKEDLEEIRKEPRLGKSRLALLVDSLASGASVFASSSRSESSGGINEMEVALDSSG